MKIGGTLPNFQISDKIPYLDDELKTMVSGFQMKLAASLNTVVRILSGLGALPVSNCFMAL